MNHIKKISNIPFVKNVVMLSSGSISAQLIVFFGSPILTRIYKPEEFGILATFLMFGYICMTISTGKYEFGVVLPKEDSEAKRLVKLAITLALYTSSILLLVFAFSYSFLGEILNMGSYDWLLLFVPVFVLLNAIFDSLKYYSLRNKFFKQIAKSVFLKALGIVVLQTLFGLLGCGALGLVLGMVFSLLLGNQQLFKVFVRDKYEDKLIDFSLNKYKNERKRYINFPKFSMPSALLNTTSIQLPVLFFSAFFTSSITGFFSLTNRVLNLPMALLGNAIGDVFIQRANEIKEDREKLSEITWQLYKTLLLIGIVPIAILFYFGEDIFAFVFGETWRISGDFASTLSFWILGVFICSPISNILLVKEKQKEGLIFQNVVFFSRLLLFVFALIFNITAIQTMFYYGVLGSVLFFSLIVRLLLSIGIPFFRILTFTVITIAAGLLPFYLLSLCV